ncbi:hypothetical protein [Providencia stuartii]|uniref:hypothetical protein n=1 Tax=Providencia stuartii TaxID=588 RepID=UPI0019813988|nr:hypothetical protein [Providencia stuartii]MBN4867628.1 hypothetical protein [Providencia stuartii]MBN4877135.1 hypothetical protein [Providencia stuartii]MBN4881644.1 hypothetical protein [Providencia stuartii]MBN4886143.1 hypothetical protein [Providencia stuartii]
MGKMTLVVEYEFDDEPIVYEGMKILGGRLATSELYDYRDALLSQNEAQAVKNSISFSDLRECCEELEVNYDEVIAKLETTL